MARLQRGENKTIDEINDLVAIVKDENSSDKSRNESFEKLLEMFHPLILKTCDKWAKYFNDTSHKIKPFNELVADAEYWFVKYTIEKYIIDGDATYNKFIKDHIDQRIRYIYECEIKHYSKLIFPDPNKHQDDDSLDPLEMVAYNYSSTTAENSTMEDKLVDEMMSNARNAVATRIMNIVKESSQFNDREKKIFQEVMCNGSTQDEMSKKLGISRTRVVQILRKIKSKLRTEMENDNEFWELITQTDIDFDNNYLT